jgi:hypothetical protein
MSDGFAKFIAGKSVAVVGPATTVIGTSQRDKIDSYDLVVRMNKALPIPEPLWNDTGRRCDIFYHCMSELANEGGKIDKKVYSESGVKWFCSPYPNMEIFAKDFVSFQKNHSDIGIPFHAIDKDVFVKMRETMGTRPNTGMCIIADLMQSGASKIYVTGFSFFKTQYVKSYRNISDQQIEINANRVSHRQPPQEKWFFETVDRSGIIELDEYLAAMKGV